MPAPPPPPAPTPTAALSTAGPTDLPLAGRAIGVTADRRADEQIKLLRRRGAEVVHAPTMATVDLTADPSLRAATDAVLHSPPDWLVVTTGMGFRLWLEAMPDDDIVGALKSARTKVIARGAKGASAVRHAGLELTWRAEHESMDDVVDFLARAVGPSRTAAIAVQLFDPDDHPSTAALRALASAGSASFVEIPVYRWRLPADVEPVRRLVDDVVARRIDAVTFTSQPAVRFLVAIAAGMEPARDRELVAAFGDGRDRVLPVCVGPVCAEACVEAGIEGAVWPEPPRLAPMIRIVEERLRADTDTDGG